jgi:hypothetical protein
VWFRVRRSRGVIIVLLKGYKKHRRLRSGDDRRVGAKAALAAEPRLSSRVCWVLSTLRALRDHFQADKNIFTFVMEEEVPNDPPVVEQHLEIPLPVEVPPAEAGLGVEGVEGVAQAQVVGEQQREEVEEGQQAQPPQGEEMVDGQQAAAAKPDDPKIEEAKKYLEEVRWPLGLWLHREVVDLGGFSPFPLLHTH